MEVIKVALIDDHPMVRAGLRFMLTPEEDIAITGEYEHTAHLIQALKDNRPDVLLLDLQLGEEDGQELVPHLQEKYPELKIIILTSNSSVYSSAHLMNLGASGYILKNTEQGLLAQAIRCVHLGGIFISPELQSKILRITRQQDMALAATNELTPREKEVLQLIAQEKTSQEIGQALGLSYRTVENYRQELMQKIGVKNVIGLVKKAILLGLIDE